MVFYKNLWHLTRQASPASRVGKSLKDSIIWLRIPSKLLQKCTRNSFRSVPTLRLFVGQFLENQPSFKIEFININMGQSQCHGFSAKDKCTLVPYFCHSVSGTVNLLWSITKCSNFGLLCNNSESISSKWFLPFSSSSLISDRHN